MTYFNFNGKLYKAGSPVIGADSRALRYGDGLFETIKVEKGRLIFEDEHFARLWNGLNVLQFEIPKYFTPEMLRQEISVLTKKNNHEAAARVRLSVMRGDGGLYDVKNHKPSYIIQTWPLANHNGEWNSNGLILGIYEAVKKSCDILSNLKHNNYLTYVMAALHAKTEKWNDAIVLNSYGRICDSTIANIFLIKDRVVYTPSLKEGCVAGVMRRIVIRDLHKANWPVFEKEIDRAQLLAADEVFLTNSIYDARWVQQIGAVNYRNTVTREIFTAVIKTIL